MLRCITLFAKAATLENAISNVQKIWNMEWQGNPISHKMDFNDAPKISVPIFSVLSLNGAVAKDAEDPQIPKETCEKMMETMVTMNAADQVLLETQRQGRITFYMACTGEEGSICASTAALHKKDMLYMQYREAIACLYRGYGLKQMIAQCMGNQEDPLKGRQMPIHYGSKELCLQQVSSPLATQIPHAAGAGYAYRLEENNQIACCYYGEGAASEGDCYAGLNFASVIGVHTLFFCRNNGFAISTPAYNQYRGDGVIKVAIGLGIPSIRVDGSDVLAIYAATRQAREMILTKHTPVLIESISYRGGHHSTSDDSMAYRSKEEMEYMETHFSPIQRFGKYLEGKGWWSKEKEEKLRQETESFIRAELARQEGAPLWGLENLFTDTFKEIPSNILKQREEVFKHYEKNKDLYTNIH